VLIIVVYTPMTVAFFYFNLPLPLEPYSWSRIHNPAKWNPIILLTTATVYRRLQYYGYTPIAMSYLIFAYYGCNNEAIDMYRKFAGKYFFLAKIWPSLLEPRVVQRRGSASRTSWVSHIDLVTKAIHYFGGVRKHSQATSTEGAVSEA
jgi:pheromone a factor receptor